MYLAQIQNSECVAMDYEPERRGGAYLAHLAPQARKEVFQNPQFR
jgi:hypothetical protein